MHKSTLVLARSGCLSLLFAAGCSLEPASRQVSPIVVDLDVPAGDAPDFEGGVQRHPNPQIVHDGVRSRSSLLLEQIAVRTRARPLYLLQSATEADMDAYRRLLREQAALDGPRVRIDGDVARRPASEPQLRALDDLSEFAAGPLLVEWSDRHGSPSSVGNLQFVRRGLSAREVWTAFVDNSASILTSVWGLGADDVAFTGENALGDDLVVIQGERRVDGIPVDGEFVEALVTTAHSRVGPGVLFRLNVIADSARRPMVEAPRERWISAETAGETADRRWDAIARERAQALLPRQRTDVTLRLACGTDCRPYWRVSYGDGLRIRIDAVTNSITSELREVDELGPVTIQGSIPVNVGWMSASTPRHELPRSMSFLVET